MAPRRQRRSLLGTPQPVQRTRGPRLTRVDPPPAPMHLSVEVFDDRHDVFDDAEETDEVLVDQVFNSLPLDPGLVHVDLAMAELVELPMEAIDMLEEIDAVDAHPEPSEIETLEADPVPSPPAVVPQPSDAPSPVLQFDPTSVPPTEPDRLHLKMFGAFVGCMVATMALVLVPWWAVVSPSLEASRQAARTRSAPQIIKVPTPVVIEKMVPMPMPSPPPVVEPDPEPTAEKPVPTPRRTRPRPRRTKRKRIAPAPVPAPTPPPAPLVVMTQPPPPPAKTPPAALALNGKIRGKAGGDSLFTEVLLGPKGRATMHVKRGARPWTTARGSYTLDGSHATLRLTEKGDGASYTLALDSGGLTGQITLPNGKQKSVKARR